MDRVSQNPFNRSIFHTLGLLTLGAAVLPALIYILGRLIFMDSSDMGLYFGNFYGSLFHLGANSIVAWSIVSGPSLFYECLLFMHRVRYKKSMQL